MGGSIFGFVFKFIFWFCVCIGDSSQGIIFFHVFTMKLINIDYRHILLKLE